MPTRMWVSRPVRCAPHDPGAFDDLSILLTWLIWLGRGGENGVFRALVSAGSPAGFGL